MEIYLDSKGHLITEEEWTSYVNKVKETPLNTILKKKEAANIMWGLFCEAVMSRVTPHFGVLFSGGVDSLAIALALKNNNIPTKLITLGFWEEGFKKPDDVVSARHCAKILDMDLTVTIISMTEYEDVLKKTISLLPKEKSDVVSVSVGSVVTGILPVLREKHISHIFTGLGSEEIFGGYLRHRKAKNLSEECWKGLAHMWNADLVRDYSIAKGLSLSLATPFLDEKVVRFGMNLPDSLRISNDVIKVIVREMLVHGGCPPELVSRKKQAAQYGSRVDSALRKLARRRGFAKKRDYLLSLRKSL